MSDNEFYNYQTVLDAVPSRIDELIQHLLPDARKQAGCYRIGDLNGERGSSLSISTKSNNAGCYHDFQDEAVRGNAIGLWAQVKKCSYKEAGAALAAFLGVSPEQRLHIPKKRPQPKITREENGISFLVGINNPRTEQVLPLNTKSIAYAESRGISRETLKAARCRSTPTHIIFPHFDEDMNPVLFKCWSCDGQKSIYTNNDPIPVLFGKHLIDPVKCGSTLIICEGQWDALTWIQLGYPAVSIPSGVSNDEWIGEDWAFLNCFSEIYLDFDSDGPGREGEMKARARLGAERCRSIQYRYKDANDALMKGDEAVLIEAFRHARDAPIERLINPSLMKSKVKERLNKSHVVGGVPFFLPSLPFEFRPHEITVWFGITSHGKSTLLSNQICYAASRGKMCMVASFEQATPMTMSAMLVQYTSDQHIGQHDDFDEAYDELTSRVMFFDSMVRANPDDLIATMTIAHKQMGAEEFVVDNGMTLDVDRQDNTAQAAVADKLRVFAAQYPVVLHIVLHPRKPPPSEASKPPSTADIMGASEWAAMAHNIICVWRDVAKSQRLSEMRDEGMDPGEIMAFDESCPDGKVFVRKQRDSGDLPMTSYRFDKETKRAWKTFDDMAPYWTPGAIHEEEEEQG